MSSIEEAINTARTNLGIDVYPLTTEEWKHFCLEMGSTVGEISRLMGCYRYPDGFLVYHEYRTTE